MYKQSIDDPDTFWSKQASDIIHWRQPFHTTKNECLKSGLITWFQGGKLNVSENCIDRHVRAGNGDRVALIWERDDPGEVERVTYSEMQEEVSRLANVLCKHGIRGGPGGDTVTLYMPMSPHAVYAMLACARIGVPHSIVFAGFSSEALASRIVDANSSIIITADESLRGGKTIPLKQTTDEAIELCPHGLVRTVLVYERTGALTKGSVSMIDGRDYHLQNEMKSQRPYSPVVDVDSEDPLFRLYTSGSTGKPKV